jgi:hypothetical protein
MTTVSPFPADTLKGRLLQHLLRSKNDPSYFNDVILQRGPMWSAQKKWSEAVVAYRQVCIESGNMTGKGWWVAGLILWYLWMTSVCSRSSRTSLSRRQRPPTRSAD